MTLPVEAGEDPDVVYAEQPPTFTFKTAREKIFAQGMDMAKLSELMGGDDKTRIVNWKYVARTKGTSLSSVKHRHNNKDQQTNRGHNTGEARTLEFRQHEGTLSPVAVEHWITFVVGLVRLAERNGRLHGAAAGYDGRGYGFSEVDEGLGVWELMERMELGEAEVGYWKGVVASRG